MDNRTRAPLLLGWLRGYRREWLGSDLVAGLTLAVYAVPVSLAYASLANLPPQSGLFGYLYGAVFALFASSRHVAVGPTSAVSLMVGTTIASVAGADPVRAVQVGAIAAILVGLVSLAAWLLRMGGLVNFVSEPVLTGFKAGVALVIASTQLPKMFGIHAPGDNFFERILGIARSLGDTHPGTLAVGIGALFLLILGEWLLPSRPVALLVVAAAIVLVTVTGLGDRGVAVVGEFAGGIPVPSLPQIRFREVDGLLPLALACFLLAYVEGSSVARTFALKHRYRIDPNRELLALGAANLAVGLGQGYPLAGGMSQSAVNEKGGAKSPLSIVVAAACVALVLLFFTGLFRNLPQAVLAAIVLMAVRGLVKVEELRFLRRVSPREWGFAVVALLGVLSFGVLKGVLLAAIFSILVLIWVVERIPVIPLGRIPGTDRFRSLANHPDAEVPPGVVVFRAHTALVYFNAENVRARILALLEASPVPVRLAVFEMAGISSIDTSAARMLAALREELAGRGTRLELAEARREIREFLRAAGMEATLGPLDRRRSAVEIVDAGAPAATA